MIPALSRGRALFSAAAAMILVIAGAFSARSDEPASIRLLFTGGVTAHLEPSG